MNIKQLHNNAENIETQFNTCNMNDTNAHIINTIIIPIILIHAILASSGMIIPLNVMVRPYSFLEHTKNKAVANIKLTYGLFGTIVNNVLALLVNHI